MWVVGVVLRNGSLTKLQSLIEVVAFFKPEPILLESPDNRFDMNILFRAVETNPRASDLIGLQDVNICTAGWLAAVVHTQGETFVPGALRKLPV